ncbi:GNAT family N-acetyltransferase [Pontixanthobacter gangjinensis]|uniref:GNAT family N-acetyltransferase n=1 Tax=Pontixanthobacter gangjinensis TaxID=1028742 RepID=A0A6I4SPV7_9SPHN|nr:GNAT family N-acetyltransferase [Pontixanthobacter gangjinensis]MXO57428.1 GNAT family N-acetyltransferase [Pontixanthobacter gangjinensis]
MFYRSERLFLRPAWPEDWEAIFSGVAEREIVQNLATAPWPYTPEDAQYSAEVRQDRHLPSFLVTVPDAGVIGSAGLSIDKETDEVQLGYWIGRKWWGSGFATEAARAVLKVAHAIGHSRITASHFIDNPASGRVLTKAGFRSTGEIRPGYSLARGRHDLVACFVATLDPDDDDGREDVKPAMLKAA